MKDLSGSYFNVRLTHQVPDIIDVFPLDNLPGVETVVALCEPVELGVSSGAGAVEGRLQH